VSGAADVVAMYPMFSVVHDQQMHHTADQTVRSYALLGFKNSPSPPAVDNGMALK
jgi:hypothetical protein